MGLFSRPHATRSTPAPPPIQDADSSANLDATAVAANSSVGTSPMVQRLRSKLRIKKKPVESGPAPVQMQTVESGAAGPSAPPPRRDKTAKAASRHSSDAITMTLAEKLGKLAAANADGLLDDDEYRILRQSLFERLAGDNTVPVEPPHVPHTYSNTTLRSHHTRARAERPPSTLNASIRSSSSSFASHFNSLLRRPSKSSVLSNTPENHESVTRSSLYDPDSSLSSIIGLPQPTTPRRTTSTIRKSAISSPHLIHRPSNNSMVSLEENNNRASTSKAGLQANDAKSIASFKTHHTARSTHAPSSFRLRAHDAGNPLLSERDTSIYDDESLTTSAKIKSEISDVEKEMSGLMDAFRGLEMSIQLQRQSQLDPRAVAHVKNTSYSSSLASPWGSAVSLVNGNSNGNIQGQSHLNGSNASLNVDVPNHNHTLIGKTSQKKTERPSIPLFPIGPASSSKYAINHSSPSRVSHDSSRGRLRPRADRLPSITSSPPPTVSMPSSNGKDEDLQKAMMKQNSPPGVPPSNSMPVSLLPPLATSRKRSGTMTSRSSSISKSLRPSSTAPVGLGLSTTVETGSRDGHEDIVYNDELSDVRRRRAEVAQRYEARLNFLRAKLKGVEIREKLSKR